MVNLASFWKTEACGQTVLPDKSVLIGQKLVENAKNQMQYFQTMFFGSILFFRMRHWKSLLFYSKITIYIAARAILKKWAETALRKKVHCICNPFSDFSPC